MGHISDQSPLQRALQTLFRGAASGARQFPQFQAQQQAFQQRQEESRLAQGFRERQEGRAQERLGFERARFGQGIEQRESALEELFQKRTERGVQQRATGRLAESLGLSPQQARDFSISGGRPQNIRGLLTKPTRPTGQLTQAQRIGFTGKAVGREQDKIFGDLQSQLEAKGVKFGPGDKDKQGFVLIDALRREAQRFATEEVDRPGVFTGDFPIDSSLIQLFNQAQSLESDTARARIAQNLGQFFPSLRQGGGQAQQPRDTTNLQSLSDEELERIARGEQ